MYILKHCNVMLTIFLFYIVFMSVIYIIYKKLYITFNEETSFKILKILISKNLLQNLALNYLFKNKIYIIIHL